MSIPFNPHWEADHLLAMPFDQYQRYRLTAEVTAALKAAAGAENERWSILDVGGYFPTRSGILPLVSFMPDDDGLVVDTMPYEGPNYQQASGTELPFPDDAFDILISCDTLEHIPHDGRAAFLTELRRVARRAVILAAPHATAGVRPAEEALAEYLHSFNYSNQMLNEHFQYGTPDPAWVEQWLESQNAHFVSFASGYLPRWQFMMFLKHQMIALPNTVETHQRLDQTYNARFYERDQRGPGYRRVYVIAAEGALPSSLQAFVERAARPEPDDTAADLLSLLALPLARSLTGVAEPQRVAHHLQAVQERFEAQAQRQEELQKQAEAQIQRLEMQAQHLETQYQQLMETHIAILADSQEAIRQAGVMEGEKRVLHQQLEMLSWQNQVLHQQLQGPGRRTVAALRQVVQRLREARSKQRRHD